MRVISISRLRDFWEREDAHDSEGPLKAWYKHVNSTRTDWKHWADVKSEFATASSVGTCVVFNIGGNKYRLVVRILYDSHRVYILKVMTHVEYDKSKWKDDCQCYESRSQSDKSSSSRSASVRFVKRTGSKSRRSR